MCDTVAPESGDKKLQDERPKGTTTEGYFQKK